MQVDYLPDDPGDPGNPGGTPTPPGAGSYGTLTFSKAINKSDASSALDVIAFLNCSSPDDLQFSAYLFIDDMLVQVGTVNAIFALSNAQQTMTLVTIQEGVSAGPHTVTLRVKNRENDGALTIMPGSILKISELRQGAR